MASSQSKPSLTVHISLELINDFQERRGKRDGHRGKQTAQPGRKPLAKRARKLTEGSGHGSSASEDDLEERELDDKMFKMVRRPGDQGREGGEGSDILCPCFDRANR